MSVIVGQQHPAGAKPRACTGLSPATRLVAANDHVQIFSDRSGGFIVSCDRTGRRRRLADDPARLQLTPIRLTDRVVGLVQGTCGKEEGSCSGFVTTYSIKTGKPVARFGVTPLDYWLTKSGAIVATLQSNSMTTINVATSQRDGATIAQGVDIDPASVAVGGGRVYWVQAGVSQSAPVP